MHNQCQPINTGPIMNVYQIDNSQCVFSSMDKAIKHAEDRINAHSEGYVLNTHKTKTFTVVFYSEFNDRKKVTIKQIPVL